ncbi:MAG: ATP-binding protein [Cyanobacteriota bacterium]|nr:ATP-binding protein [Cyanobacteriota bacterium]
MTLRGILVLPWIIQIGILGALASYLYFWTGQQVVQSHAAREQQQIAFEIEQKISQSLSKARLLNELNASNLQQNRLDRQQLRSQGQSLLTPQSVSAVYYATAKGTFAYWSAGEGEPPGGNPKLQRWYKQAVSAGKPVWSNPHLNGEGQQPKVTLSQPVYNPAGQLVGVVGADVSLRGLDEVLKQQTRAKKGEIVILDRALNLIATSADRKDALIVSTMGKLEQQSDDFSSRRDFQQQKIRLNGQPQLVGIHPFSTDEGQPNWSSVVLVPESAIAPPALTHLNPAISLSLLTLGIASAIALWNAHRIAQPLLRLQEAATQIARGNWQPDLKIDRNDELGDLAVAFNAMAQQLQTSFAQLEDLNQAILENESRLLQFLEVLPVGVSIHDTTGKPIYLNRIAQDLLGKNSLSAATLEEWVEAGQIYLASTQQLYPIETFPVARSLAGEKVHTQDLHLRKRDRTISLEMWSTPIVAETGVVAYAIAAFLDISQRKQAEQLLSNYNRQLEEQVAERTAALARTEAELKGLFAAMSERVFVLDCQGRYRTIISKNAKQLEETREIPPEQTLHQLFVPEQVETFLSYIQRVIKTQQTLYLDYSVEVGQQTVWFEASLSPLSDETIIWVARDISDRQALETQLRTSEAKLRAVFETLPDLVLIFDKDNNIEAPPASPSFNWLNPTVEEFWSEGNGSSWLSLIEQVRDSQQSQTLDYSLLLEGERAAGNPSLVWFSAQIAPLPDRAVIWVARNISDRKAAEIALQEAKEVAETANRAKSAFLANMSHELRSPLNAVLGFAQLLGRSSTLTPDQRENVSTILRSGEHLLGLINQVLDLSKIEAERATLNESNFDLYQLFDDIEDLYALKAEEKGLQLTFEYTPDVPRYIQSDRVKLRQILVNLLSNALKFTPYGGRIALWVKGEELRASNPAESPLAKGKRWIAIAIEDTGSGIAPEELKQLFEAFQQTQTGKNIQEGTGLGLAIVHKFVQLMQGTLTVTSNGYTYSPTSPSPPLPITPSPHHPLSPSPTHSIPPSPHPPITPSPTQFSIHLPVQPIEATALEERPLTQRRVISLAPNQPQYRILAVDDKDYNRQLLFKLLTPLGFEVQQASNGQEAIALWEAWNPHLIWMDMRMPILDGYEASRFIKTQLKGQATVIIALTASILEEERAITLSAGCDDYVRKPFQAQVIFEKMSRYLGVNYIYENLKVTPAREDQNDSSLLASLKAMPSQWVQQLYQAADLIDNEQIFGLLEEIPPQHSQLVQSLKDWVNSFRCDKIIDLIENCKMDDRGN